MVISQKLFISSIVFFLLLLCTASCNTTEPPPDKTVLTLTLEDVSCTEAWVTLTTNNLQLPAILNLLKDNTITKTINLQTADTLLYIDSLLPNTSYQYQVTSIQSATGGPVSSNELSVTTLDTTSHNFTWQTWTFGGGGEASFINDVAIIDENNIYACGEIYLPDSLGNPDDNLYNVLHWDGNNWRPKRISAEFRGNIITPAINGIQVFSTTDIWFASSLPIHGDGENWTIFDIRTTTDPNLSVSKVWGTSSNNIYFVGRVGSIAHYNGESFSKIESGTSTIINDIWGIVSDNNETIIYAPVSSFFTPGDKKILRIKNNQVDSVSWNMNRILNSVWTTSEKYMYVCGSGVFENKKGNWKEISITSVVTNRIRGNNINDIFVTGDFGFVAHFNGIVWKIYHEVFDAGYSGLAIKGNTVAIVGQRNGLGIITIGRRN
jgi:hypothetical protein